MKQLGTIGVVVLLLLGAAIYYSSLDRGTPVPDPVPTPDPMTKPTEPIAEKNGDGPTTDAEVGDTLKLRAAISNGYVPVANTSDLYAAIDIDAIAHEGDARPPLNVAVVLDRSGSMSGQKIEHAKAAARRIVNMLGDGDRLAFVSYGSDVTVDLSSRVMTSSNRQAALRAIDSVLEGGGTNLSGGFQRGFDEIGRWKNAEAVNRLILMSDGHANIGITSSNALVNLSENALETGVSVTTMGMGLDYNEDLMTAMANKGAGNYYFIDQPSTIVAAFDKELQGLKSVVARNAAVVVTLGDGVELSELFGYPYSQRDGKLYIKLAEFNSSQSKDILMKLNARAGLPEGASEMMKVELVYDDLVNDAPKHHQLALESVATNDAGKVATAANVNVIARVQQVEVATTMQQAMKLYEQGRSAEATSTIEMTQQKMRERRAKYELPEGGRFDSADRELDEIKSAVQAAPASSTKGKRLIKKKKSRSNAIVLDSLAF
jgi:Ca-activated chloride channel family protein